MHDYDVSGCIVTHNNIRTISATIHSLLEHTKDVRFHLYIVDNHSTDGTADYIAENFPAVTLLRQIENKGFGAGHNVVLPLLQSKYHVVINPDVLLPSDSITSIAEFLDASPDIGMVSPKICFEDGRPQILGRRDPNPYYLAASRLRGQGSAGRILRRYAMLDEDNNQAFDIQNASGCFFMIRTELFAAIRGFDEKFFLYFEDCDLSRRARAKQRLVYYPGAVVLHEWHRESKKNKKLAMVQICSMLRYFYKWRGANG